MQSGGSPARKVKRIHVVYAHWCPHCYPLVVEAFGDFSSRHGIDLNLLDIDIPEQEQEADRIVRTYGDWSEDYLIPQVFLEFDDGTVQHIFTGYSEGVAVTAAQLERLLNSPWIAGVTPAAAS